jgi:hypothetical protein
LISQATVSDRLQKLLDDASSRDQKIPFRGGLLDLFGVQVIRSDSGLARDFWPYRSMQISMIPTGQELPTFDHDVQQLIASEFQAKLLSFRRANLGAAGKVQFDASRFSFALRDLARSMAVATPDDCELQAEVFELLLECDAEIRSEKWIDLNAITLEAVLVACYELPGGFIYCADLAETAEEILKGRGVDSRVDPGVLGKRLKLLGFETEPRDAKGKKLKLTEEVRSRARQLARDFGNPQGEDCVSVNGIQQRNEIQAEESRGTN